MKRRGLKAKFVLHSVWILTGLGAAVTFYSVSQLRGLLYDQMFRRVEAQSLNWIEANTSQILLSQDPQTLQRLIGELKNKEMIAYVDLRDAIGASRAALSVPQSVIPLREMQPGSNSCMLWREVKDFAGSKYLELSTCISVAGTGMSPDLGTLFGAVATRPTIGELRVGLDRRQFDRILLLLILKNVGLASLLIFVAICLSLLFAHRMVTPISSMGKAANQIASGNLSQRVLEGHTLRDELGDLVCNFNRMAARLEANRDEMAVLYWHLEEKVRERTSELQKANEKLKEIDRRKSEFFSTVSHELRTPLTSIKAYAEILLDAPDIETEMRGRFLSIIDGEASRMSRLITDLLNLEKIESGIGRWNIAAFDLREIVRAAALVLAPALDQKALRLTFAMPESQVVFADPDRIQEVLTNLLGNAIKFCEPSGRVEIALSRTNSSGPRNCVGDYIRVEVTDDGPGVPSAERSRIFEMFYQGVKGTAGQMGAGLGLAISRKIVLRHQGEIWLDSKCGTGTVFCFTLPRCSMAEATQREPLQEACRTG